MLRVIITCKFGCVCGWLLQFNCLWVVGFVSGYCWWFDYAIACLGSGCVGLL